jgi:hypothetical protein
MRSLRQVTLGTLVACMLLTSLVAVTVEAQESSPATPTAARSVEWTNYDVTLELDSDGTLRVTERQEVDFRGGPFNRGFATLPTRSGERIDSVQLSEQGPDGQLTSYSLVPPDDESLAPQTYQVRLSATQVDVDWWFDPTVDRQRVFVLTYEVHGAVRASVEELTAYNELWWTAIGPEVTTAAPVRAGSVTVLLPEPVDPNLVLVSPVGLVSTSVDGTVWRWEAEMMGAGDHLTARMRFPAFIAPGATPAP